MTGSWTPACTGAFDQKLSSDSTCINIEPSSVMWVFWTLRDKLCVMAFWICHTFKPVLQPHNPSLHAASTLC